MDKSASVRLRRASEMDGEHHLLLGQSDEEGETSPKSSRRSWLYTQRSNVLIRGRARKKAQGAAHLMGQWAVPSTSAYTVCYWLGVTLSILILIIIRFEFFRADKKMKPVREYEELPKITTPRVRLPTNYPEHVVTRRNTLNYTSHKQAYMHVFMNKTNQFDIGKKYMEVIHNHTKAHEDFNFTLYVIVDPDFAHLDPQPFIHEDTNNDRALEMILSSQPINKYSKFETKNLKIKELSLKKYFEESPLALTWHLVAPQNLPFLCRVVSLWEYGGMAFDPDILFNHTLNHNHTESKHNFHVTMQKLKSNHNTTLDWNGKHNDVYKVDQQLLINTYKVKKPKFGHKLRFKHETMESHEVDDDDSEEDSDDYETDTDDSILQYFYAVFNIFSNNPVKNTTKTKKNNKISKYYQEFPEIPVADPYREPTQVPSTYKPVVEKYKKVVAKRLDTLFIDRRGLFIATKTICHSFIGLIFTTAEFYVRETTEEIILKEVWYFCKGALTCKGLKLI